MKSVFPVVILALALPMLAQTPKSTPALSTADKVALQNLESEKQELQKKFLTAQQTEAQIVKEFETAHPGFRVNQQTFQVIAEPKKDAVPEAKKDAAKK